MAQNFSGIVIAGFGEKEIFPSLVTYAIEGRLSGALKYKETENKKITLRNWRVCDSLCTAGDGRYLHVRHRPTAH